MENALYTVYGALELRGLRRLVALALFVVVTVMSSAAASSGASPLVQLPRTWGFRIELRGKASSGAASLGAAYQSSSGGGQLTFLRRAGGSVSATGSFLLTHTQTTGDDQFFTLETTGVGSADERAFTVGVVVRATSSTSCPVGSRGTLAGSLPDRLTLSLCKTQLVYTNGVGFQLLQIGQPVHAKPVGPQASVLPVVAARDGLLHIRLEGVRGAAAQVRILGGLASGGRWFGWVPLVSTGPGAWRALALAPGFLGVYPLQVRVHGRIADTGAIVKILPRGFARRPGFSSTTELAAWWVRINTPAGTRVIAVSTWCTGFFTHRDPRLNRLLHVVIQTPGMRRPTSRYLSIARLSATRPWRLLEAVPEP